MIFKTLLLAIFFTACSTNVTKTIDAPVEEKRTEQTNGVFKAISPLQWMLDLERVANCVKQKPELYLEIRETQFTRTNGKSSEQIADELKQAQFNIDAYSKWTLWKSKEVATFSKQNNAALFRTQMNPRSMPEMIETAFHEPMHILGYFHDGNFNTEENRRTVPYKIGEIARKHIGGCE